MPCVSVIVPMYNVNQYVFRCIESLRSQTFDDFEVVCVDDGSTDTTGIIAHNAAAGDSRFRFIYRENGGLSVARNSGLKVATGDYVCFLDADDWYEPNALEVLYTRAHAEELDVLVFSAQTLYETVRARKLHEEEYDFRSSIPGIYSGQELFSRFWSMREYVSSACFYLVRRALLEDTSLRFGEGLLHEDELFTPLVYAHAKRAAFLNVPLYDRRMREGSIMTRRRDIRNVHSLFAISQILHAWLIDHIAMCEECFVDALAQDIAYIRDAAFMAAQEVGEEGIQEYISKLDAQERLEFNLSIRYVSDQAHERYCAVMNSRTYQLGDRLVAIPRSLRTRLGFAKIALKKNKK